MWQSELHSLWEWKSDSIDKRIYTTGVKVIMMIEAYIKSIDNNACFEKKTTFVKKLKMFGYYMGCIIINKHSGDERKKIHIINGRAELRLQNIEGYTNIYYGFMPKNFKEFRLKETHLTVFTRKERVGIFFKAIKKYKKSFDEKGNWLYWVDFFFWNEYLKKVQPKVVLSNGHYDRLTTALSYLCKKVGITFYIQQHGLIYENQYLAHKIFCDKFYAFDAKEEDKFRRNIILNENCCYEINYIKTVHFTNDITEMNLIGIIDQPIKEMENIIDTVMKCFPDKKILVMMHPLCDVSKYKKYSNWPNIVFDSTRKELNLELLVAGASTLVYDYLQEGFSNRIIFIDLTGGFSQYKYMSDNLVYINSVDELEAVL